MPKLSKTIFLCCFALLLCPTAETATLSQTKDQLKILDKKINALALTLKTAHNKQEILHQELSKTEKEISTSVQQLNACQQKMNSKQHSITLLEQEINTLKEQIHTQQLWLAKHIRAQYTMGDYEPLKWLLNQDTPYSTSRLLTLYQYLLKSRLKTIDALQLSTERLKKSQQQLHQEIIAEERLQVQIHQHQQALEQNKQYSNTIIQSLNQDIQNKEQTLADYQKNKDNLSQLLNTLAKKSIVQRLIPFISSAKKLPFPVNISQKNLHSMNQGLIFFANEGMPVNAVSTGKVVFSDWLKGYGLLLIIDHGQGFMTLYAHNQSLFKQKGDNVQRGEQIATVGHSGGIKQNGLYFEIRQRGKAVPPLKWLT